MKRRLGIQTATIGNKLLFVAKVVEICINKIYPKLNKRPMLNCIPAPPLILLEPIATATIVSIIDMNYS